MYVKCKYIYKHFFFIKLIYIKYNLSTVSTKIISKFVKNTYK